MERTNGMVSGRSYEYIGPAGIVYPKTIFRIDEYGTFGQILIADRSNASYFIYATGSITRRNEHREINERRMTNFPDITRDENSPPTRDRSTIILG